MSEISTPPVEAPSSTTWELARLIRGFGLWFAIGLGPFLGLVPFKPLPAIIEMYPQSIRWWLIPLSALLMGMIAVVVEFADSRRPGASKLHAWFVRTVLLFAIALVILIGMYRFLVVRVHDVASVVTGTLAVPKVPSGSNCKCSEGQPTDECVEGTTLNPANIRSCFGANRIALAEVALSLIYLIFTGSFVAAVGLLLLERRRRRPPLLPSSP